MIIDTHSHLNFNSFKNDAKDVIKRSLEDNVWMINVGSKLDTSEKAAQMAKEYSQGVYASVGLHPIHAEQEFFDYNKYKELAKNEKVVAIGEIGLDYKPEYYSFKNKQKEVFLQQLDLAEELSLPAIIHCRMAHDELIEALKTKPNIKGVIHCFTGDLIQAKQYLEMGFYIGLNGIIFKFDLKEIIKEAPIDRILFETDCPYLTPPLPAEALAKAGQASGRNEPIYVKYVAEEVAKIKNMRYEEVSDETTKNAKKLFKI